MLPYISREEIESYISHSAKLSARVQANITFLEEEIENLKLAGDDKQNEWEEKKLNSFLFASKKCLWVVNNTQQTLRGFLEYGNVSQKILQEKIKFVLETDFNFEHLEHALWMHFQR